MLLRCGKVPEEAILKQFEKSQRMLDTKMVVRKLQAQVDAAFNESKKENSKFG